MVQSTAIFITLLGMGLGMQPDSPPAAKPPTANPQRQAVHVTPVLVSEHESLAPGERAWLGVEFKIQSGWHIYWNGTNDTGMPPSLEVVVPDGFKPGSTLWPAPRRNVAPGGILDHIYESDVLLLVPVEVPKDAQPETKTTITINCKWLVCSDVCLPEEAKTTITLPIAKAGEKPRLSPDAPRFAETRLRIPTPLEKSSGVTAKVNHRTLEVESPGASKLSFFPDDGCVPMPHLVKEGEVEGTKLGIKVEPDTPKSRAKGVIEVVTKGSKHPAYYSVDLEVPKD